MNSKLHRPNLPKSFAKALRFCSLFFLIDAIVVAHSSLTAAVVFLLAWRWTRRLEKGEALSMETARGALTQGLLDIWPLFLIIAFLLGIGPIFDRLGLNEQGGPNLGRPSGHIIFWTLLLKFGGYYLFARGSLKPTFKATGRSTITVATVRTIAGLIVGGFLWMAYPSIATYFFLAPVRFILWWVVIHFFISGWPKTASEELEYAGLGTIVSYALDLPVGLADLLSSITLRIC